MKKDYRFLKSLFFRSNLTNKVSVCLSMLERCVLYFGIKKKLFYYSFLISELKQNLVDTRKNYNCYVEKIEKYSKLAADCRSSSDRVVSLYNNPPVLDFTAISSLLGKINKVFIYERACMDSE